MKPEIEVPLAFYTRSIVLLLVLVLLVVVAAAAVSLSCSWLLIAGVITAAVTDLRRQQRSMQ